MPARDCTDQGAFAESGNAPDRWSLRLRWYLNRLRCMTPLEVAHRLARAVSVRAQRAGLPGSQPAPPPTIKTAPLWVHPGAHVDPARYLAAAERIAAGRLDIFALRDVDLGCPPPWNRDPKTRVQAPLSFGKLLDYRDPQLVGDVKYLWELNRHLHLVTLAQAYALSGERRYLGVIRQQLESWFAACPCPLGPNWSSALEAAIRLINWSVAWQLLGAARSPLFAGGDGERFRDRWLASVYQHARFVRGHFSLHSSANNHLIGEAAGLFIAALTWPFWPRARLWAAKAKTILEKEALRQVAPDGVDREQAVAYQHFVLDLLLLCLLAGKANRQWFSTAFEARVEAMFGHLASIMDCGGQVPMIGDSDDAVAVRFAQADDFSPYRSLLATGAILFSSGEFKRKAGVLDDKTRWLLGAEADAMFERVSTQDARLPTRRTFPAGGYYILGCDFESENEIRLVADAGPLGYTSIAAHGHADALSFTLSVGGMQFLVDPGTCAYHMHGRWRRYFRGTSAHNTVCVDGEDQSQQAGNFMWLRKARAGCAFWSSSAEADVLEAWHDGYRRLPDPVLHRRRIVLDKASRRILIEDRLEMAGAHDVLLLFHCSEHCRVDAVVDGFTLEQKGRELTLRLPTRDQACARVFCGSTAPLLGWVSRRYDERQPSPTIAWSARIRGDAVLRSEILC